MTATSEILTPCDPFRMARPQRERLRCLAKSGPPLKGEEVHGQRLALAVDWIMTAPALEIFAAAQLAVPRAADNAVNSSAYANAADNLPAARQVYAARRSQNHCAGAYRGTPASLLGKQANYLIRQIDQIEEILRGVPEGQRPPPETMLTLLDAWLEHHDMASPPPLRDVYPSRRAGLEWHRDEQYSYSMHRRSGASFEALTEAAKHDAGAYEAALALAKQALRAGDATPRQNFWVCQILEGNVKKPRGTRANRYLTAVIVRMVEIAEAHNYDATKGDESQGENVSGCDLAAAALARGTRFFETEKRLHPTYASVKQQFFRGRKEGV